MKILILATLVMVGLTFAGDTASSYTGTYGVKADGNIQLQISFLEDGTFLYINKTAPGQSVELKGKWTLKGRTFHLSDYGSTRKISEEWTVDKDYPCVRSRKGLEWTRLCKE